MPRLESCDALPVKGMGPKWLPYVATVEEFIASGERLVKVVPTEGEETDPYTIARRLRSANGSLGGTHETGVKVRCLEVEDDVWCVYLERRPRQGEKCASQGT